MGVLLPIRGAQLNFGVRRLHVDSPSNFKRLVERFRGRDLFVHFRRWGEGDTVFVGWGRKTHDGVEGFARSMYIGQRPNGAYYAFDFVETNDEYSEDEVVQYVEQRLTASPEAFEAESRSRTLRNRYRKHA